MLPAGDITEKVMRDIAGHRDPATSSSMAATASGNTISNAPNLAERSLHFVDVGVSGGVWGLERGYCMMIGGPDEQVDMLDPFFQTLAPGIGTITRTRAPPERTCWQAEQGYVHCGPAGSGHFVKMIHNGIEYGMMQAYAEGFDILQRGPMPTCSTARYDLNLSDIAEVWRRGSVISSWLLDLISIALAEDQSLAKFSGRVADSRRRPLDDRRGDGGIGPGRRARRQPVRALPQPGRGKLCRPTAVGDALRIWRPCRNAAIVPYPDK